MSNTLNDKKILVIGANGMLGSMLMRVLPQGTTAITQADVDISDGDSVAELFKKHTPDVVINAAAYTAVDDCEEKVELANAVNGAGPWNLAEHCAAHNTTLVHYSTDYVFAGDQAEGYTEEYTEIAPVNAYGASKALGEAGIQEIANSTGWGNWYIVRTAWLYGPDGGNFVDTMLKLAEDRDTLSVVNDQHGSPTYTRDLANATQTLLSGAYAGGIYHVTNDGNCTWYEFAQEIFKQANVDITVNPCSSDEFPRLAKRPQYSKLINTKLPTLPSWQAALHDYLQQR